MKTKLYLATLVALSSLGGCSKIEPAAIEPSPVAGASAEALTAATVSTWGPQITTPGVAANPLPGGGAGMYFVLSRSMDGVAVQVLFDGSPLSGVAVDGKTVTAELPASQFAALGRHSVALKLGNGQAIDVGNFVVAATLPKVAGDSGAVDAQTAPDAVPTEAGPPGKSAEPPAK